MKAALLLIDFQKAFENEKWGERNNADAEYKAQQILSAFRNKGILILHVQHTSNHPESVFNYERIGWHFKDGFEPQSGERIFQKSVNSAFIGTDLDACLRDNGVEVLFICGLTLPHCVSTTTRMAANLGFSVSLITDATATFALPDLTGTMLNPKLLHDVNIASLQGEFAEIITTEEALQMLDKGKL